MKRKELVVDRDKMYAITEENEATNGSKKIAPFKKMAPEELLVTSRPATNAGQLSLTVRTLQHTGHPHPVLVLANLEGCIAEEETLFESYSDPHPPANTS
jgi:hypothetical protein